jgi:Receptor family ligand binding region
MFSIMNNNKVEWIFNKVLYATVCQQISTGIAAVFGPPYSDVISRHVDCVTARLEIPHVVVAADVDRSSSVLNDASMLEDQLFTINLHPDREPLRKLYSDLVRMFSWSTFVVVYSQPRGILHKKPLYMDSCNY